MVINTRPTMKTPLRNNITKRINGVDRSFFPLQKNLGALSRRHKSYRPPRISLPKEDTSLNLSRINQNNKGHVDHIEELSIHLYDIAAWYQDKKSYIDRISSAIDIKIDQILFLRSVPHVTRRARRAPTSKNNTCVTKTRNSHQYEANLKTDHIKGNNPKKKKLGSQLCVTLRAPHGSQNRSHSSLRVNVMCQGSKADKYHTP